MHYRLSRLRTFVVAPPLHQVPQGRVLAQGGFDLGPAALAVTGPLDIAPGAEVEEVHLVRLEGGAGLRDAAIDDLAQDGDGFRVGLGGGEVDEQIEVFIVLQNFQVGLAAEGDTGDDQRRVAALDEDFERAVAEAAPG